MGNLFRPDNYIYNTHGAWNSFGVGHYTLGAELMDRVLEAARKEIELCDTLQGFIITHSLGGGTGSGMGTLLLSRLREEYPDRIFQTFSILPSKKVDEALVAPYNATLSMHQLTENADGVFCIANEALYNLSTKTLKQPSPSYDDINSIAAAVMANITSCMRFPGDLNETIRKLTTNLVPYPRLHFFVSGLAPLNNHETFNSDASLVSELTKQMFDESHLTVDCNPKAGRYLSISSIYRGNVSMREADDEISNFENENKQYFPRFIPDNVKTCYCKTPSSGIINLMSATSIINTTAIQYAFQNILDQFNVLFKRKAFLHGLSRYLSTEGMDEMEFIEVTLNLK